MFSFCSIIDSQTISPSAVTLYTHHPFDLIPYFYTQLSCDFSIFLLYFIYVQFGIDSFNYSDEMKAAILFYYIHKYIESKFTIQIINIVESKYAFSLPSSFSKFKWSNITNDLLYCIDIWCTFHSFQPLSIRIKK